MRSVEANCLKLISTALAHGLLRRRKEQYVVVLIDNPCTRRNGVKLSIGHLLERDMAPIEHLDGLSVQSVGDFSDAGQFAFLSPFDQLGCDPAQCERIAPERRQKRIVDSPSLFGALPGLSG